jgi:hypothetical protein
MPGVQERVSNAVSALPASLGSALETQRETKTGAGSGPTEMSPIWLRRAGCGSAGPLELHHIASFIESTANELLQGVLAGGILYYHGMALAAECLALDLEHRHSPEMTRTIGHAMTIACAPAGQLLRDQVRWMRQFLRDRRCMVFGAVKHTAKDGINKLGTELNTKWDGIMEKCWRLFRSKTP